MLNIFMGLFVNNLKIILLLLKKKQNILVSNRKVLVQRSKVKCLKVREERGSEAKVGEVHKLGDMLSFPLLL